MTLLLVDWREQLIGCSQLILVSVSAEQRKPKLRHASKSMKIEGFFSMENVKGICFMITSELLNYKKLWSFCLCRVLINITAKSVLLMVMTSVNG